MNRVAKRANSYKEMQYRNAKQEQKRDTRYDREPQNKAVSFITKKYGVSKHSVERFCERVLHIDFEASQMVRVAKAIRSHVPSGRSEGKVPLFDNVYAIMNNGIVITVLKA